MIQQQQQQPFTQQYIQPQTTPLHRDINPSTAVGTLIFRPLEARFNQDNNWIIKMNPYCKFKVGWHTAKSSVDKHGGKFPKWTDSVALARKHGEEFAKLKLKDKDRITRDDNLGESKIMLREVIENGRVNKWFNLYKGNKITGEILLDIEFNTSSIMDT